MKTKDFIKLNILLVIVSNFTAFLNYLFQFLMGRMLNTAEYGVFNAINAFAMILSSIFAVFPLIISKYVIEFAHSEGLKTKFSRNSLQFSFALICIFFAITLLFKNTVLDYLKISSVSIVLISLISAAVVFNSICLSFLQGLLKFKTFTSMNFASSILKLILAVSFIAMLGSSARWPILATTISSICFSLLSLYFAKNLFADNKNSDSTYPNNFWKDILFFAIPAGLTIFAFNTLSNIDIVLVKNLFSETETGIYSSASIIGKIALFLPGILTSILFPQVIANEKNKKSSLNLLFTAVGITALLSGSFTIASFIFPELIIKILFGIKYIEASSILPSVALAMSSLAILNIFMNFLMAKKQFFFLFPVYGSLAILYFGKKHINFNRIKNVPLTIFGIAMISILIITIYLVIKNSKSFFNNSSNNI